MHSTFGSLEIGRKALQAQQRALDVTGHNIANANTQGYSRQVVSLETTTPYTQPSLGKANSAGQIGTGVQVDAIIRQRDSFLDAQYRAEMKSLGRWEVRRAAMEEIEVILNELSGYSLGATVEAFREAVQRLSYYPESEDVRTLVIQTAVTVTDTFNHLDRQLADLQMNVDEAVTQQVSQANDMIERLYDLNKQIIAARAAGDNPNDLNDKRDLLLDDLPKIINIQVQEDPKTGGAQVTIGGKRVVHTYGMAQMAVSGGYPNKVVWADNGAEVTFGGLIKDGSLKGYQEVRDEVIGHYRSELDALAKQFAAEFNAIHVAGFDLDGNAGIEFFTYTGDELTAETIQVNQAVITDNRLIAAAASPDGGGGNALTLSRWLQGLDDNGQPDEDPLVVNDYMRQMVARLGIEGEQAQRMVENQDALLMLIENQRSSVSGVDIDEEMTNMIRYQHAYNAAARLVTAIDEMLSTIINGLGLVGR
ncbi:MAG: flagellar hook-associated protein FlgK [bacterium]